MGADTHEAYRKGIYQTLHDPLNVESPRVLTMKKLKEFHEKERLLLDLEEKPEEPVNSVLKMVSFASKEPKTQTEKRRRQVERFLGIVLTKRDTEGFNARTFLDEFQYGNIEEFRDRQLEKIENVKKGKKPCLEDLDKEIDQIGKEVTVSGSIKDTMTSIVMKS
jgi:hypothetical protein